MMSSIYSIINFVLPFVEFSILLQDTQDYNYLIYLKRLFSPKYKYIIKRNFINKKSINLSVRNIITIFLSFIMFVLLGFFITKLNYSLVIQLVLLILLTFFIPIIVLIGNLPTAIFRLYYIILIYLSTRLIKKNNKRIVAITGSTGKTSTRKMLTEILQSKGSVLSTEKNYNTLWGNAKVLSEYKDQDYVVLEFAMDSPGHVGLQSRIIKPNLGVILNIGHVHSENIGDIEKVYKGKKQLSDFLLKNNRPVILNADDERLKRIVDTRDPNIITFGFDSYEYKLIKAITSRHGLHVSFEYKDQVYNADIPIYGDNFAYNVLASISIAKELGVPISESIDALQNYSAPEGRFQIKEFGLSKIVNDAYNANPTSMDMALRTFDKIFPKNEYKRIVILGDMKELGSVTSQKHKEVGELVESLSFNKVYYIGDFYKDFKIGQRLHNWQEAKAIVDKYLEQNKKTAILLKASNSIGLYKILD